MNKMTSYASIPVARNDKTSASVIAKKTDFLSCKSCFCSASYLNLRRDFDVIELLLRPSCNENRIVLMPFSTNDV
jgi:hypothetical protein